MASEDDSDKRGESKGNNWVWYLILTSIILLSVGMFVVNNAIFRMKYPRSVWLLEATRYVGKQGKTSWSRMQAKTASRSIQERSAFALAATVFSCCPRFTTFASTTQPFMATFTNKRSKKGKPTGDKVKTSFRCNKDNSDETSTELRKYLDASNVDWGYSDGPTFMNRIRPVLIMIGPLSNHDVRCPQNWRHRVAHVVWSLTRQTLRQDDIGITFDDIAALTKRSKKCEIVDFLKYPDKYQRRGGRIPKGVLLVGPPGTGKTLLAKPSRVKPVCRSSASQAATLWRCSSAWAPLGCAICFNKRALNRHASSLLTNSMRGQESQRQHGWRARRTRTNAQSAPLVEMDGFDANIGIIIIAATNRPETLDPALLRPGRFDRNVLVKSSTIWTL